MKDVRKFKDKYSDDYQEFKYDNKKLSKKFQKKQKKLLNSYTDDNLTEDQFFEKLSEA
jgi:Txe/YoeB family toxin of Txe-Axe toxin-antitoxin module